MASTHVPATRDLELEGKEGGGKFPQEETRWTSLNFIKELKQIFGPYNSRQL